MYTYMHIYTYTCIHVHRHTYAYMHTHTHKATHPSRRRYTTSSLTEQYILILTEQYILIQGNASEPATIYYLVSDPLPALSYKALPLVNLYVHWVRGPCSTCRHLPGALRLPVYPHVQGGSWAMLYVCTLGFVDLVALVGT